MAIKHRLAAFVCAWSGHDCECCSRCLKVLARDSLPLSARLRHMEASKR
jgi:hypothetical protein